MPGILGFIKESSAAGDPELLKLMLGSMAREAFYASGTACVPELGLAAGWVRKNANEGGLQWNPQRTVGLLLSGELFFDGPMESHSAKANRSGAEQPLIKLYESSGLDFLRQLNGWFSGVLVDLRKREIVLFNDRYGLGRLYFHLEAGKFLFSSEAKPLLKVLPGSRRLDDQGVAEWLSCGCVLQNRTLFPGIFLLPPGAAWTFVADGEIKKQVYFQPSEWESQPRLSADAFYEELKGTFSRVLPRYLNGAERVAMSLTGGLDGRMIMSWLPRAEYEMPCYTFNGPVRDCEDVKIARKVASECGKAYQTIPVGGEFFKQFPELAAQTVQITDGAMDVSGSVELYVNRLARNIAPVRLTGNYGSEILRSNVAFRPRAVSPEIFNADFIDKAQAAAKTYAEEAAVNRLTFIAFKQVPWHHYSRFAVEQSQIDIRSPFLDNDLVALAFRAPAECAASLEPSLRLIAEGNPRLARIPTDRGITYPAGGAGNRIRRSIKEFLARAEYAYDYGMPDWLARADKSLALFRFERLFLGRQKFCHFRSWYRKELAGPIREMLLDQKSRERSYLKGPALETLVNQHIQGTRNFTLEIHKLLSLELMQRVLWS